MPHCVDYSYNSEKMYHFTQLAIELNEPEEGIALSDSRLRPDLRLMEEAKWDEANKFKVQLEEKQRATRRRREAEQEAALKKGIVPNYMAPVNFKEL